jgi:hypothetical protein
VKKDPDLLWFGKHFPNAAARKKADEAVDKLDSKLSMTEFLDAWIAAYVAAGGRTSLVK